MQGAELKRHLSFVILSMCGMNVLLNLGFERVPFLSCESTLTFQCFCTLSVVKMPWFLLFFPLCLNVLYIAFILI